MTPLQEFIAYLEEQVRNHSIYVWGAQGQGAPTITEAWIERRETSPENAERAIKCWNKQVTAGYGDVLRAFDCSGLGMYWLQNLTKTVNSDMSSNTMMSKCKRVNETDLKRGDWVFRIYTGGSNKGKAYHIGYVVDDDLNVIEAMGRDAGVVKRTLSASGSSYWNAFGRPKYFAEEIEAPVIEPEKIVLKITKPLMYAEYIGHLQVALNAMGYDCGAVDRYYGTKTDAAARDWAEALLKS